MPYQNNTTLSVNSKSGKLKVHSGRVLLKQNIMEKIEIKSHSGKVLFTYEAENATIKDAVEQAIKEKISLSHADLYDSDLSNANLTNADLYNASFSHANLTNADLSNSNLSRVSFFCANLTYTNLTNSNLSRANFRHAKIITIK